MSTFGKYDRINMFALELVALVSQGCIETISDVEKHMYDNDLVYYIYDKYNDKFNVDFGRSSKYDIESYNQFFYDMSSYINGNESRKYGIVNENDGLLLIVAVILDLLKCPKE